MIKEIKECDGYFFHEENKKLYGINGKDIEEIEVIDQDGDLIKLKNFHTKANTIYFKTEEIEKIETTDEKTGESITLSEAVEKNYTQKNGNISEIKEWTEKAEKTKKQMKVKDFTVKTNEYKKNKQSEPISVSDVINENEAVNTGLERFGTVDGILNIDNIGLWFSTPDGRKDLERNIVARWEGLYFWAIDKKNVELVIKGVGQLFEMN